MKIKFKHQEFQEEAARSVVRAFAGQPREVPLAYKYSSLNGTDFRGGNAGAVRQRELELDEYGNAPLAISREAIAANVRAVQQEQGLEVIGGLEGGTQDGVTLTIEMETGTGKTFTYIKTMFELNRHYGWSKFVVVVPSVAIREGVYKSFEMLKDYFADEYGKRIQHFVYNSKNLEEVRSFAQDSNLHVMIINMQAFNTSLNESKTKKSKDARIIFSPRDSFGSRRPIDVLAATHPIMIVDEPQSVLGANVNNATRKGITLFEPLFRLLYSATHREVFNMVYRLDAIDAYNKQLVKKIEVKGIHQVGSTASMGYIYLEEIVLSTGNPQARISYDRVTGDGEIRQATRVEGEGFNLYEASGALEEYEDNYVVEQIDGIEGTVRLLNGLLLKAGDAVGAVSEEVMRRMQIRETIKTHLERERQLYPRGIKVLSLFFIDRVERYRTYAEGTMGNGLYAKMFEEEYARAVRDFQPTVFDEAYRKYLQRFTASEVHNGYFSRDRKGNFIDSKIGRGDTGSSDEGAYDLIMKDKERLLSLEEPTRFIFSHSALKEGWDNPNVFQICTLKNSGNETSKRQEVGRGMRLCVDRNGERQDSGKLGEDVFGVNVLTVIASESYEQFSKQLQREIAEVVRDRPRVVTQRLFEGRTYTGAEGQRVTMGAAEAGRLYEQLRTQEYVNASGKLTAKYAADSEGRSLTLGEEFAPYAAEITAVLRSVNALEALRPQNARRKVSGRFLEERFHQKEFQALWQQINVKSSYRVNFDRQELIGRAVEGLNARLNVAAVRLEVRHGVLERIQDRAALVEGTAMTSNEVRSESVQALTESNVCYDLIGSLVEATGLTRRTIVEILQRVNGQTFSKFATNPEEFIRKSGNIINEAKAVVVVQKITYERLSSTYTSEIFTREAVRGTLGENALRSAKSLYDTVVVDSLGIEKRFAEALEQHTEVAVYTKLPRGFYINTPMGHYSPDWAIAFNEGTVKHIYFVAETKGSDMQSQLRVIENAKIDCARKHFEAIAGDGNVRYDVVTDYAALYSLVSGN